MIRRPGPAGPGFRRAAPWFGGLLALVTAVAGLSARPAEARRIFVPREYPGIQAAIDAATAGDTIWVHAGVYAGTIRMTKKLVLFGDGGPDSTILDGGDSVRVVHVEGVNGGHILGFTIRRGKAPGGGGIYCLRDSLFSISSCRFEKNWEAGLASWQTVGVLIVDNVFRENEGSGIALNSSSGVIRRNQFFGNRNTSGGAIALVNSKLAGQIQGCYFEKNEATAGTGGAVFADSSLFGTHASTFVDNHASVAGGAVSAMNGSQGTVGGSIFRENSAGSGAAVHSDTSTLNVVGCVFDRNRAIAGGAAIQAVGRGMANVNPLFEDNTFYKNESQGEGAAILCQTVSPDIRRSIFVVTAPVKPVLEFDSVPAFECNLMYDPGGAPIDPLPPGSLVGDPQFCDPEGGDFRVRGLSPASTAPCGPIGALKDPCSSFKVLPDR